MSKHDVETVRQVWDAWERRERGGSQGGTQLVSVSLKPAAAQGTQWLYFPEQWDAKSPWYDERVRRAATLAIDRKGINEALTYLRFSPRKRTAGVCWASAPRCA